MTLGTGTFWYVSSYTPLGVRALFVGQSRDVAALSGISSDRIRWGRSCWPG
jgi:ribose transport system permease protein